VYQNPLVLDGIAGQWFDNSQDEGIIFHAYFNPVSTPIIALVLTAVGDVYFQQT